MGINSISDAQAHARKHGLPPPVVMTSKWGSKTPREAAQQPRQHIQTQIPTIHDPQTDPQLQDAKPERHKKTALGRPVSGEKEVLGRVRIRITGHRVRPLDPDNFAASGKDCIDFLRHSGLISGDEPWRIILETEQVKVGRFKDEKTEIEITYPE